MRAGEVQLDGAASTLMRGDELLTSGKVAMEEAELKQRALERVRELCEQHRIQIPKVRFDLRGAQAGQAIHDRSTGESIIRINLLLYRENAEDFLANVIPHELCHIWKEQLHKRGTEHGRAWQALMRKMGVEPRRCHQYDTTHARVRRINLYEVYCACPTPPLVTSIIYNRLRRRRLYCCTRCHNHLWLRQEAVHNDERRLS